MPNLQGKIITIPEMEAALKEYGCNTKITNTELRKFCAILEKQIIKTRLQTIEEITNELYDFADKLKEKN